MCVSFSKAKNQLECLLLQSSKQFLCCGSQLCNTLPQTSTLSSPPLSAIPHYSVVPALLVFVVNPAAR